MMRHLPLLALVLLPAAALMPDEAAADPNLVEVCHDGAVLAVNGNAVPAFLRQGDFVVTAEVCGDQADNDCDGEVDEDCGCPCWDAAGLIAALANTSDPHCEAYGPSEPRVIADDGLVQRNVYWPSACYATDAGGELFLEVSPEEIEICAADLWTAVDALGLTCVLHY